MNTNGQHTINREEAVNSRYGNAAKSVEPALCCPVAEYDSTYLANLPQEILDIDYGCGDPSSLVLAASSFALPVSTTHVSCSSIFAIGLLRGRPHWPTIGSILLTWFVTLPLAIILGAVIYTSITAMMQ